MVRLRSPSILSEVEGLIVERLTWTKHSEAKMSFYHLSKQRVQRVLNFPKRIESGIAPNTIAMMQLAGSKKHPYEIWVMVQNIEADKRGSIKSRSRTTQKIVKIISAWKYPGRTKPGESLPEGIFSEIHQALSSI